MTTFKEDEDLLNIIREVIDVENKLEPADDSKIRLVLSQDERKKLETLKNDLYGKLIKTQIGLDRIRLRETPHSQEIIDFLRTNIYFSIKKEGFSDFYGDNFGEILDFHQDTELIERGEFLRNYFELIPPYIKIGTSIPEGIINIYHESRWCFVYRQYSAVIALSRAVIETVLKSEFKLEGNLDNIITEAKDNEFINKSTAWNANKIRRLANDSLHKAKPATKDQAKDAINYVLKFLEEIYFK